MYLKKNRKTKSEQPFFAVEEFREMFPFRLFWRFFVFDNFAYHTQHNAGTFLVLGLDWPFTEKPR